MLAAVDVSVAVAGRCLLHDVSVTLRPGRLTAVLGPNGAGKSTLLGVLAGDRAIAGGRVTLAGRPIASATPAALARCRAVVVQQGGVAFGLTVGEAVALGRLPFTGAAGRANATAIAAARRALELDPLWDRACDALSGGERQRVQIARATAQLWRADDDAESRCLLLDEPTAALDIAQQASVMAHVRRLVEGGVAALMITHDLNLAAAYATDGLLLAEGRVLAAGALDAILTPSLIARCYGAPVELVRRADGRLGILS